MHGFSMASLMVEYVHSIFSQLAELISIALVTYISLSRVLNL